MCRAEAQALSAWPALDLYARGLYCPPDAPGIILRQRQSKGQIDRTTRPTAGAEEVAVVKLRIGWVLGQEAILNGSPNLLRPEFFDQSCGISAEHDVVQRRLVARDRIQVAVQLFAQRQIASPLTRKALCQRIELGKPETG